MAPGDDVTLGELARIVSDLRTDVHRLSDKVVARDVFEEVRKGTGERIGAVEGALAEFKGEVRAELAEGKERATANFRLAVSAFIAPLIVGVLVGSVLFLLRGG